MVGGRPRSILFNVDYFENINTPDKAYWLGFIFGDGTISDEKYYQRLKIGLAEKDINHIKKFAVDVMYPKEIVNASIRLHSKKMVLDLIDKGVFPNKTYRGGHPINVPSKFFIDCARGLFDADGSISYHPNSKTKLQAKLTTNKELLEWFKSASGMGNSIIPVKGKKHYEMRISASVENFTKLYGNAYRYLDRKYELIKDHILI